MLVAGLIGDPVEHSLSPVMHNVAFQALGIDARYELWPTTAADLGDRIASLRNDAVLGANVTVPHKGAVMPLVDEVSETARRIGAVNTLIPRDGQLVGDNTDAYGFGRALRETVAGAMPSSTLVVGAGGAARAVLVALQDAGIDEIGLVNRTLEKAQALAADLNEPERPAITAGSWMDLEGVASTALLRLASARGLRTMDGLPMLIHQGARAFELWTGQAAPVEVMTAAVREGYDERR